MIVALIVAGSVLVGLLLIAFIVWAHQYTKVGPNEGHLRAAVGAHSIEDVYRDRAALVTKTKDLAGPDLGNMGLEIVSLTIRQISDKQGYLEALGRPRTAEVKRDAIRGEAEAEREAKAARYAADTAIEESRRDFELQKSGFRTEGQAALARADLSYDLQRAISQQEVRAAELEVEIVERQKAIQLMDAEVKRRINELEAELIEPAKAEARKIESLAEARKEELAAQGAGEADSIRLRGLAEAEAMVEKAKAWSSYNEAAIADRLLSIMPQLAAAVS